MLSYLKYRKDFLTRPQRIPRERACVSSFIRERSMCAATRWSTGRISTGAMKRCGEGLIAQTRRTIGTWECHPRKINVLIVSRRTVHRDDAFYLQVSDGATVLAGSGRKEKWVFRGKPTTWLPSTHTHTHRYPHQSIDQFNLCERATKYDCLLTTTFPIAVL